MNYVNDFLLNLFTGNDELRPIMMFPNDIEGVVFATDAHAMIAIPSSCLGLKYQTNKEYPDAKRIMDEFESNSLESFKLKTEDIAKELTKVRIIVDKERIKCKECGGGGDVYWEYEDKEGETHYKNEECPVCEGECYHEKESKFARLSIADLKDEKYNTIGIKIENLYFAPFQLYRLMIVALIKGFKEIEILYDPDAYSKTLVKFDSIKVLNMLIISPE